MGAALACALFACSEDKKNNRDDDNNNNPTSECTPECGADQTCTDGACVDNNTNTVDPACAEYIGADDGCDCGCGVIDPDCDGGGCSASGCQDDACAYCLGDDGLMGSCDGGASVAPDGWTCDPSWYGDTECDCGCSVADSDCADVPTACTTPGCQEEACVYCNSAEGPINCVEVPAGWTCDPLLYAVDSGDCICGCGVPDLNCTDTANSCTTPGCRASACDGCFDGEDQINCVEVPAGWTCDPLAYSLGNGSCVCGCGIADPNCTDAATSCTDAGCVGTSCDFCTNEDGELGECVVPGPEGWNCPAAWYSDTDCDCGCGIMDPTCGADEGCAEASCVATGCDFCWNPEDPESTGTCE